MHRSRLLPVAVALLACGGCEVTSENVERWKGTEKGPSKLRDAVKSGSVKPDVRAQALAALVELGMLSDVASDLKEVADGDRKATLHAAVPRVQKLAEKGGRTNVSTVDGSTTRVQREAKDALFVLREWAAPEDQQAMDVALVDWLTVDLGSRMSAGGQGGEKIFEVIGARAAPKLAEVVADASSSSPSRMAAAEQLGRIGDPPSRERAAAALVERARKERNTDEAALKQIGLVGGDHAVAYLTALAEDGHLGKTVRQKALLSLAQRPDPAALPAALRLAGDERAPDAVRDAAFEVAEKIGPAALPGLIKLLDDKNDLVRWRAVEAALAAGKADAVAPVLAALSPTRTYGQEDVRSFIVHDLRMIGAAARKPLRDLLRSKSWVARMAAVEGLAEVGKAEDASSVAELSGDNWKLKGWPDGATIGSEAKRAAESLKSKN